jgi:hypothetical protein
MSSSLRLQWVVAALLMAAVRALVVPGVRAPGAVSTTRVYATAQDDEDKPLTYAEYLELKRRMTATVTEGPAAPDGLPNVDASDLDLIDVAELEAPAPTVAPAETLPDVSKRKTSLAANDPAELTEEDVVGQWKQFGTSFAGTVLAFGGATSAFAAKFADELGPSGVAEPADQAVRASGKFVKTIGESAAGKKKPAAALQDLQQITEALAAAALKLGGVINIASKERRVQEGFRAAAIGASNTVSKMGGLSTYYLQVIGKSSNLLMAKAKDD